jgi:protein-S-isoprenylcysteine O-methyltransferase Ste14
MPYPSRVSRIGGRFSAIVLVLVLLGACAMVADVISPTTPTPLLWPRVLILAGMLLLSIRSLVILRAPKLAVRIGKSRTPSSIEMAGLDLKEILCLSSVLLC